MARRQTSIFAVSASSLLIAIAATGESKGETSPAERFAAEFSHATTTLIQGEACIDPSTGSERKAERKGRRKRQRELQAWFAEMEHDVRPSRLKTDQDQANYADFRTLMASKDLLAMSFGRRTKRVRTVTDYLSDFERFFSAAWGTVVSGNGVALQRSFAHAPGVKIAYFGRGGNNAVASLYSPASRTMYLDLNALAGDPEVFLDSLEHELWHHLVPTVSPGDVGKNIWWEGFNEALAEWWRVAFDRLRGASPPADSQSVEYPVQVAFASFFLGSDRERTIRFLAGAPHALRQDGPQQSTEGALDLQQLWDDALALPPAKQKRIEAVLTAWRWKEDDGSPVDLSYLITEGRLDDAVVSREFISNRQYLVAVIKALTVVELQAVKERLGARAILGSLTLPDLHRNNLARVLRYVASPDYELPSR